MWENFKERYRILLDGQVVEPDDLKREIKLAIDEEAEEPPGEVLSGSICIEGISAYDLAALAVAAGISCQELIEDMNAFIQSVSYGGDEMQKLADLEREERRLLREYDPLPRPERGLPAKAKHYRTPAPKPRPTARAHIRNIRDVKGRTNDRK